MPGFLSQFAATLRVAGLFVFLSAASGCGGTPPTSSDTATAEQPSTAAEVEEPTPPAGALDLPPEAPASAQPAMSTASPASADDDAETHWGDLQNVHEPAPGLFCGSAPATPADYQALQAHKIRTLIRIDGVPPDARAAGEAGIQVVHAPVPFQHLEEHLTPIAQAVEALPGPVYICCQYGKPRSPAVAALLCRWKHGWTAPQAEEFAAAAGVTEGYGGILQSLQQPPLAAELPPRNAGDSFPQSAETNPMVRGMAVILQNWDPLRSWKSDGLPLSDEAQAKQLQQHALSTAQTLEELRGLSESQEYGEEFLGLLEEGAAASNALAKLLETSQPPLDDAARSALVEQLDRAGKTCGACHRDYRN